MPKRRNRGGRPRQQRERYANGRAKPESTLPTPELIAKRVALVGDWMDQRGGTVFGILHARGHITLEERNAGEDYRRIMEGLDALLGSPRGFETRSAGRGTANDDPIAFARLMGKYRATVGVLATVPHSARVALARASVDAPEALAYPELVKAALRALELAGDAIREAGRVAANAAARKEEAA